MPKPRFLTVRLILENLIDSDLLSFSRPCIIADRMQSWIIIVGSFTPQDVSVLEYLNFESTADGSMQWKG